LPHSKTYYIFASKIKKHEINTHYFKRPRHYSFGAKSKVRTVI